MFFHVHPAQGIPPCTYIPNHLVSFVHAGTSTRRCHSTGCCHPRGHRRGCALCCPTKRAGGGSAACASHGCHWTAAKQVCQQTHDQGESRVREGYPQVLHALESCSCHNNLHSRHMNILHFMLYSSRQASNGACAVLVGLHISTLPLHCTMFSSRHVCKDYRGSKCCTAGWGCPGKQCAHCFRRAQVDRD